MDTPHFERQNSFIPHQANAYSDAHKAIPMVQKLFCILSILQQIKVGGHSILSGTQLI